MAETTAKKGVSQTTVVTDKCRLSYVHVLEPQSIVEGGEKKFSVSVIIPKSNKKLVDKIEKAILAAKEMGKKNWNNIIPKVLKEPLRDGDLERPEDPPYANAYFVGATSKTRPNIVDLALNKITDATEIYSGMYGRVSMNFYPFNQAGNKGIACGLNNIQKVADGEPLGGRTRAEDDFNDGYEDPDDL